MAKVDMLLIDNNRCSPTIGRLVPTHPNKLRRCPAGSVALSPSVLFGRPLALIFILFGPSVIQSLNILPTLIVGHLVLSPPLCNT